MKKFAFRAIVTAWEARDYCARAGNEERYHDWNKKIEQIQREVLPNGSGFDIEPMIVEANDNKIIIYGFFHPMDENGMYDDWINFSVTVRPSLRFGAYCEIRAHKMKWPRHYDHLKDYVWECYDRALRSTIEDE